jgi:hypothetical protein
VPWGNRATFYRAQPLAEGLVILGRIESDVDALNVGGTVGGTIEAVK